MDIQPRTPEQATWLPHRQDNETVIPIKYSPQIKRNLRPALRCLSRLLVAIQLDDQHQGTAPRICSSWSFWSVSVLRVVVLDLIASRYLSDCELMGTIPEEIGQICCALVLGSYRGR